MTCSLTLSSSRKIRAAGVALSRLTSARPIRETISRPPLTAPSRSSISARFLSTTQTHRIIRAGIPFGDEVSEDEERAKKTALDRGLMFVCYQTSIETQFEFIQQKWANNPQFP